MAYFNRNNQVYQQRDNQNNTWGWFPNNQEMKRGETAPTEKGKREKVIGSNQQKEQLAQFNAVAAASGFQLNNTANIKEAIGKFKSSPYYSSVVNQQNQKKQSQHQHNQHLNNQGGDIPKMSKQQHIQQISRIYQNNPTNILHSVTHNSNFLQNHSGSGTTTNKKAHALDPYSSNSNAPQKYGIKLPQRPSTSHDQQQVQRKQNQIQGITQYKNTQMSITNTDGFRYKKPQTPGQGSRIATAGQRGSKLLNTSGNSLLNSSINNGNPIKQQANGLYPLQVRNASLGNNGNQIKRRETFSTNNNNNSNQNNNDTNLLFHKSQNQIDFLTHKGTNNTRQIENNQLKQNLQQEQNLNNQYSNISQIKVHHADFKKDVISKQNFFTHENFYCQGEDKQSKQDFLDKKESINNHEVGSDDMNDSFSHRKVNKQQQQLLRLSLPQANKKQTLQQSTIHQNDDASESNTPRIIVTGNQEQQSHKIQYIDNSFTKYEDDEDETTIDNNNTKSHAFRRKHKNNNSDLKQKQSQDDEGEGDDEHEDDQDEEDEEYHNYYNSGDADNIRDKQYAVPFDEDDDDYYGEEEQEDDEGEEEEDENYEGHQWYPHEEHENQHYQFYQNQNHDSNQNRDDSSDDNQVQNFIQDDEDEQQHHEDKEDQFGESQIQTYMRDKQLKQKEQITQITKEGQNRPMTTEGGRRRRGIETPVQNSIKQNESFSKIGQELNQNKQQNYDNADVQSSVNRRQSEKENFNLCLGGQNESFNDDQFEQEFRIDFDTSQFERPPERGKQFVGVRVPIKVDHQLNDESHFGQGPGKRPPSRHKIPNRAAGLGIPTQDLPDIPIKNMYNQDEDDDKINEQNRRFFKSEKLQIEKIKQAQDNEDTFMNFDFKNFGENVSRKNSSRQPVAQPKMAYNDRPQSGNIKSRALNKRESFDDGVNSHQQEKINQNNVQNLKLDNHPISAKNYQKSNSINQKENDQVWDDLDDILNDKQTPKNIIRRLEGSDILIKHNVNSTMNNKKQNTINQPVKVPFETSLGSDFLSLFANNFGN